MLVSSDASLRGPKDRAAAARELRWCAPDSSSNLRTVVRPAADLRILAALQLGTGPSAISASGLSSALIRDEISPGPQSAGMWALGAVLLSTLFAFVVSRIALGAPRANLRSNWTEFPPGNSTAEPVVERGDELGAVSTKIVGIGKQLRDVREIFSTLRENLDQVMSGLGDGLLLFNAEGRAVLVSPSVEKFLGRRRAEELRGRRVSEIFPARHPARGRSAHRGQ